MFNHLIQIRGKGERNTAYKAINCYVLLWHQTPLKEHQRLFIDAVNIFHGNTVYLSSSKAGDTHKNGMLVSNNPHPHHPEDLKAKNSGWKM